MKYTLEIYSSGSDISHLSASGFKLAEILGDFAMYKEFTTASDLQELLESSGIVKDAIYRLQFDNNRSILLSSREIKVDDILSAFSLITDRGNHFENKEALGDAKGLQ